MNRQEVLRVNRSVFVTYVFLQKPLPKTLTFNDEGKVRELARRSETLAQPTYHYSFPPTLDSTDALSGKDRGIPHLAKNQRDMGHPSLVWVREAMGEAIVQTIPS
jgi:hypothetical protein